MNYNKGDKVIVKHKNTEYDALILDVYQNNCMVQLRKDLYSKIDMNKTKVVSKTAITEWY